MLVPLSEALSDGCLAWEDNDFSCGADDAMPYRGELLYRGEEERHSASCGVMDTAGGGNGLRWFT